MITHAENFAAVPVLASVASTENIAFVIEFMMCDETRTVWRSEGSARGVARPRHSGRHRAPPRAAGSVQPSRDRWKVKTHKRAMGPGGGRNVPAVQAGRTDLYRYVPPSSPTS